MRKADEFRSVADTLNEVNARKGQPAIEKYYPIWLQKAQAAAESGAYEVMFEYDCDIPFGTDALVQQARIDGFVAHIDSNMSALHPASYVFLSWKK